MGAACCLRRVDGSEGENVAMKLKSKSLYLLLPFIIIINSTALYLWKKLGWTKPTLIFTLLGIGTILFFFLMNQFYEYLQGNRYFIIGGAIFVIIIGLHLWINSELPHIGICYVLIGLSLIFNVVLKRKWKNICVIAVLVLAGTVLILGEIEEINQDKTPTIGKAAGMQQEAVDKGPKVQCSREVTSVSSPAKRK